MLSFIILGSHAATVLHMQRHWGRVIIQGVWKVVQIIRQVVLGSIVRGHAIPAASFNLHSSCVGSYLCLQPGAQRERWRVWRGRTSCSAQPFSPYTSLLAVSQPACAGHSAA